MHRSNYKHKCTYTYPFFILCIEFHAARMQTKACRSHWHGIKCCAGLLYSRPMSFKRSSLQKKIFCLQFFLNGPTRAICPVHLIPPPNFIIVTELDKKNFKFLLVPYSKCLQANFLLSMAKLWYLWKRESDHDEVTSRSSNLQQK
jgi:hypothetical protein